ncbi:MAG: pyridoxamine 5'-phosphate oxidase family protein, partial [Acidimicrobiales bacterium]
MQLDKARSFLESNHRAVLCTRRQDGSPLMSPVVCALDEEGKVVVSTRETAMKTRHIRREGAMSLCVMGEGFFGEWIQVDGPVQIVE